MQLALSEKENDLGPFLEEMKDVLGAGEEKGSFLLKTEKRETAGYSFSKQDGKLFVTYGTRPDLARALVRAASGSETKGSEERRTPDFGYMADCARNGVPTVDALKRMVKVLACMGYQFLGLYIEDIIRIPEEPYVGYMRGAYSKEEIGEVIRYADIFGVEIRPYVETLAHLNQITRYSRYQKIIDTDDILLAGEEETYRFLDHYLGAVSDAFRSRRINIGMDEAHMVGLGKYLDKHGFEDRVEIILKHLDRVMEICRKYGFIPEMWSDMFFRLAFGGEYYVDDKPITREIHIPEGLTICYWDYYTTDEKRYDRMLKQHLRITDHVSFAAGAWRWATLSPSNAFSIAAGRPAIRACRKNQISSIVITGWGDDGSECSQFGTLPTLFADANEVYEDGLSGKAYKAVTGMSFEDACLADLGNPFAGDICSKNNAGKLFLYNDPLIGTFDSTAAQLDDTYYADAAEKLDAALRRSKNSPFAYVLAEQNNLCRLLVLKAKFGDALRTAYKDGDREALRLLAEEDIPQIVNRIDSFYAAIKDQWSRENKPFGFEVLTVRFGGLRQRMLDTKERIQDYLDGKERAIPELAENYLPQALLPEDDIHTADYLPWWKIVSPSVIGR